MSAAETSASHRIIPQQAQIYVANFNAQASRPHQNSLSLSSSKNLELHFTAPFISLSGSSKFSAMKKLYRKGTVHPTPSVVSEHLLSFLPAAILTLSAALSPGDREVLAYLISCSSANFSNSHRKKTVAAGISKGGDDHPPCFNCNCFRCYMSYWVKWDSSPNRQLIHEIIDAFEDSLLKESKKEKNKRERRKGKSVKGNIGLGLEEPKNSELSLTKEEFNFCESNSVAEGSGESGGCSGGDDGDNGEEEELEKGSVRRLVSFLGERIWSVWG